MKIMNKVIATMMMMAITTAMPAMAGNKNHNDKKDKVVAVNNGKKESNFDKVDKKTIHFDTHKKNTNSCIASWVPLYRLKSPIPR